MTHKGHTGHTQDTQRTHRTHTGHTHDTQDIRDIRNTQVNRERRTHGLGDSWSTGRGDIQDIQGTLGTPRTGHPGDTLVVNRERGTHEPTC